MTEKSALERRPFSLHIGEYTISEHTDTSFWIGHESGEGMQISKTLLEDAIREFYKKHF